MTAFSGADAVSEVRLRVIPEDLNLYRRVLGSSLFGGMTGLLNFGALPLFLSVHTANRYYEESSVTRGSLVLRNDEVPQKQYSVLLSKVGEASAEEEPTIDDEYTYTFGLNAYGVHVCSQLMQLNAVNEERQAIRRSLALYAHAATKVGEGYRLVYVTCPPNAGIEIPVPGFLVKQ